MQSNRSEITELVLSRLISAGLRSPINGDKDPIGYGRVSNEYVDAIYDLKCSPKMLEDCMTQLIRGWTYTRWPTIGELMDVLAPAEKVTKSKGEINRREQFRYCDRVVPIMVEEALDDVRERRPDWELWLAARKEIERRAHYFAQYEYLLTSGHISQEIFDKAFETDPLMEVKLPDYELDRLVESNESKLKIHDRPLKHWWEVPKNDKNKGDESPDALTEGIGER